MGIQIGGLTRNADGTVTLTGITFPTKAVAMRALDDLLAINADAYAPREPTAPAFSHAESVYRAKVAAAEQATGRCITAYVPRDTTLGGQPLPPAMEALMDRQMEEPQGLKAGEAYAAGGFMSDTGEHFTADEAKPGGTD